MANPEGKKILLVEPAGNLPFYILPLALGYLKSNIPEKHHVKILDCSMDGISSGSKKYKEIIEDFNPDIVGVSASMQTYKEGIQAVRVAKSVNKEIITVMGGAHPSIFAEQVMKDEHVDYVFRGEAELSFSEFLDQLKHEDYASVKGLAYRKNGEVILNDINLDPEIDRINIPDYEHIQLEEYIKRGYSYGGFYGKSAPIWMTRGCPYACSFCSASLINGKKIRRHSISYVMKWLDHLYKKYHIRQFALVDDNFTFQKEYAKDFCRNVIQLRGNGYFQERIYFATPNGIRIDYVDEELLDLMKKAGWNGVSVAPESGSRRTLKRMRKNLDPDAVPMLIDRIKKAGLDVRAFFMIGYPGETEEDVKETIKLIRKSRIDALILGKFLPIPGTPIFDELVKEGEIDKDYMPPSIFKFVMPLSRTKEDNVYSPKGLEKMNTFTIFLRESVLLAIRNPNSIIFYMRYYGIVNLIRKLLQAIKAIK
jgi:anaerobic magnesium-protoporphyrin IX monomethyl ester cyclase